MFGFDNEPKQQQSRGVVSDLLLARLRLNSKRYKCGLYIQALNDVAYTKILQSLEDERITRKANEVTRMAVNSGGDWNRAMLTTLMRSLSDRANKYNYISLGMSIDPRVLERESDSLLNLETILIYCSGLISTLPKDSFTESVRRNGEMLAKKYNLTQLSPLVWHNVSHVKHPIVRLSQVAYLYYKHDMLFNRVISCRTRDDVLSLFGRIIASKHWLGYIHEGKSSGSIGVMKGELLAINLVVTMLHAYGMHFCNDEMVIAATELLENLPAESNQYINGWRRVGIVPRNAYETQALIQLAEEYCFPKRCSECPIAAHMSSPNSLLDHMPGFIVELDK